MTIKQAINPQNSIMKVKFPMDVYQSNSSVRQKFSHIRHLIHLRFPLISFSVESTFKVQTINEEQNSRIIPGEKDINSRMQLLEEHRNPAGTS